MTRREEEREPRFQSVAQQAVLKYLTSVFEQWSSTARSERVLSDINRSIEKFQVFTQELSESHRPDNPQALEAWKELMKDFEQKERSLQESTDSAFRQVLKDSMLYIDLTSTLVSAVQEIPALKNLRPHQFIPFREALRSTVADLWEQHVKDTGRFSFSTPNEMSRVLDISGKFLEFVDNHKQEIAKSRGFFGKLQQSLGRSEKQEEPAGWIRVTMENVWAQVAAIVTESAASEILSEADAKRQEAEQSQIGITALKDKFLPWDILSQSKPMQFYLKPQKDWKGIFQEIAPHFSSPEEFLNMVALVTDLQKITQEITSINWRKEKIAESSLEGKFIAESADHLKNYTHLLLQSESHVRVMLLNTLEETLISLEASLLFLHSQEDIGGKRASIYNQLQEDMRRIFSVGRVSRRMQAALKETGQLPKSQTPAEWLSLHNDLLNLDKVLMAWMESGPIQFSAQEFETFYIGRIQELFAVMFGHDRKFSAQLDDETRKSLERVLSMFTERNQTISPFLSLQGQIKQFFDTHQLFFSSESGTR